MRRRYFFKVMLLSLLGGKLFASRSNQFSDLVQLQRDLFPPLKTFFIDNSTYMHYIFSHPKIPKTTKRFILDGTEEINLLAYKKTKRSYKELTFHQRQKVLQQFTKTPKGKRWALIVMRYAIEAAFSDPIYGANKDTKIYQWIGYQPGVPRPKVIDGP